MVIAYLACGNGHSTGCLLLDASLYEDRLCLRRLLTICEPNILEYLLKAGLAFAKVRIRWRCLSSGSQDLQRRCSDCCNCPNKSSPC